MLIKFILYILFLLPFIGVTQTLATFSTAGTFTWTAPCDVTSIQVECWGGGAGGGYGGTTNKYGGGGGGGGAYTKNISVTVVPGITYSITVAATAAGGTSGSKNGTAGNSSFAVFGSTTVTANGGSGGLGYVNGATGGAGGLAGTWSGGAGANGLTTRSGGGGEGAATTINGNLSSSATGGTGTNGGDGGAGTASNGAAGSSGVIVGGGGGGGTKNSNGGAGAIGKVVLTYTSTTYCTPTFTSAVEPITNVTFAGINNTTSGVVGGTSALETLCNTGSVVLGAFSNSISVSGNTDGNFVNYIRVFIDWNIDGDFVDSGESFDIGSITNCASCAATSTIDVPCTATVGTTRMRVMKKYGSYSATACEAGAWGQAEDYNLTITAEPGSATPTTQPTSLSLTAVSGNQINGSFTASTPASSNYLVIRTSSSSAPSPAPIDGSFYTVGQVVGGGTVVSINSSTTFSATGLSSNTAYWFWVYSYNGSCSTKYLTVSPLNGTATTMNVVNWNGAGVSGGTGGTDFNTAANWLPTTVPSSTDNANITTTTAATITLSASATIGSLTILNNATTAIVLAVDVQTNVLTINGDLLTNVNAAAGSSTILSLRIGNTPGNIIVGGSTILGNNSNTNSYIEVTGSASGTTTGSFTMKGNTYFGDTYYIYSGYIGKFVWDAPVSQTIYTNNVYDIYLNGTCQIGDSNFPLVSISSTKSTNLYVYGIAGTGNLTVKAGSTLDLGSKIWNKIITGSSVAGGVLTLEAGSTLKLGATSGGQTGSNFPLNFTTSNPVLNVTSTVDYTSTSDQTIFDVVSPGYGNLTLTNNSIKSASTALDIQSNLTINSTSTFGAGTSLTHNVGGNWSNSGTFSYTTGNTITFNGAANQDISGSSTTSFNNLTNSNSSTGLTLNQGILVSGTLSMSGATANINLNGYNIDLSTAGTLSGESNTDRIYGTSGVITTTRNLSGISALNVAEMGCILTTIANMGSTTISRGHASQSGTGLVNSTLQRYYVITPTVNSGLNATMVFNYFDNELNGLSSSENSFELYRSEDYGITWTERYGGVNTVSNYVNLTLIDAFSTWTVSIPTVVVLPIELTAFTGKNEGRNNRISWTTFTEINNDYFTVERSVDGKVFEKITNVSGAGTSSEINEYSINDVDFSSGINYYRLRQTDFNGTNKCSELISIDNRVTSKTITKIINLHGQEVDEHFKGVVIIVYSDNSILRTVQM